MRFVRIQAGWRDWEFLPVVALAAVGRPSLL
jgi:hypothetical protein